MSYLIHHGILGMKWGVRRYQNADGSYTDAGRSRYGMKAEKRIAKLTKYRDRKAKVSARKASDNRELAKQRKLDLEDLEKYGTKSKTFEMDRREQIQEKRDAYNEKQYESTGKYNPRAYDESITSWADSWLMSSNAKTRLSELKSSAREDYEMYSRRARHWQSINKKLMNTEINEITTKGDLRRMYWLNGVFGEPSS